MDWKLEVVQVPVTDVDRAKRFYSEQVGFAVDLETRISDEVRIVQLTPPGSGCSIQLSTGIHNIPPGVLEGLQLVVPDIEAAQAELRGRGLHVGEVQDLPWGRFLSFDDPDGNAGAIQQLPARG